MRIFVTLFVLMFTQTISASTDDMFYGFNCQEPFETKFINHANCRKHTDTLRLSEFMILQKRTARNIIGYECKGSKTSEVSYCGRYSHNKATGESLFNLPIKFHRDQCLELLRSKVYSTGSQSFPLKIGSVNSFSTFTHGGVKFNGANIACTGQTLRLSDGSLNSNMMRQVHFSLTITEINLMQIEDEIIQPYSQTVLGAASNEYAYAGSSTFVWENIADDCDLMKIMQISMKSISPNSWFNDQHRIEVETLESYHDDNCQLRVIKTTSANILLASSDQVTDKIPHIDSFNVDISVDSQMRFGYINSKISSAITSNYKQKSPICTKINSNEIGGTMRVADNTFIRNLGDLTVQFNCKKVHVAPVISDKCHAMMKVQDLNGEAWHLDPANRILMKNSVTVQCTAATVPVYRTTQNTFVTFTPARQTVQASQLTYTNTTISSNKEAGLYPPTLVKQWLDRAFIQHLAKHSFSLFQSICRSESCLSVQNDPERVMSYIGDTLSSIADIHKGFMFGLNLEKLGGRCSIAVCVILAIYSIYAVISWFIRLVLFKDSSVKMCALLCRATFPDFFLITKTTPSCNQT